MKYLLTVAALTVITLSPVKAQTLKEAIRLNENEQQEAADAMYKELITMEPSNGVNYYYAGENMIDAYNAEAAEVYFRDGLTKDPAQPLLQVGLAELLIQKEQLEDGKAIISKVISAAPKNALLHMEAAEALMKYKSKDLLTSIQYLEVAAKLEPKNVEVYNLLGDVYSEQNNGTLAATNYNKSLELDKNQAKPYLHKGQLYKRSTNYDGAIAEFNNALAVDPNFAPAYRELGEAFYMQRKMEKAKENYRKYLELSKNNPTARLRYSAFLFYSDNFKDAFTEWKQIQKIDSAHLGQMRLGAYLSYENGEYPAATQMINRVFSNTTEDTAKRITLDYVYYGKILSKTGNDSLGAAVVQRAFEMDTTRIELMSELGNIYLRGKKYPESATWFQRRVNAGGKVTTTDYYNLGKAYYLSKNYGASDSAFAKVIELQNTWAPGWLWRGKANVGLDPETKNGLAKPYYEHYIEMVTADSTTQSKYTKELVEANGYLAYYYLVQKDCTQSSTYWKKLQELDPANKQAKEALDLIKNNPKANCK
jgi:tetratricopeptide (TPR) repeat protein